MIKSVTYLFCICLLLATIQPTLAQSDACSGDDWGTSGQFAFYVFAQSWSAEFCQSHSSYPGCTGPTSYMQQNLTMHGMWPNYNASQSGHWWPQCCSCGDGPDINSSVIDPILSQLQTYWPNEQDPTGGDLSNSLWAHEWAKHGTCSGLDQGTYFKQAIYVQTFPSIQTPSILQQAIGGNISKSSLESAYNNGSPCPAGDMCLVALQCDTDGYLSDVFTCWSPSFQQVPCPVATVTAKGCPFDPINILAYSNSKKLEPSIILN